uniref:Rz1 family lipoprotein n=1 Tax=Escherichia coli TaxID=562 RepID=UPI001140382F|nr:Rz1 family lipoprotein [Escherichia coli]
MREPKMKLCVLMLPLVVANCASTPSAPTPCVKPPPPPAWIMQPAPDLLTPLNGIISPSESESQPATE